MKFIFTRLGIASPFFLLLFIANTCFAQTNLDSTDYLANLQKQYIIRIDVANGNIYLPYKKKLIPEDDTLNMFKKTKISSQNQNNYFKTSGDNLKNFLYIKSYHIYSPRVGSMIRLIYENVPKNYEVATAVEMTNQNLEYATLAQGYLSGQNEAFKNDIKQDTAQKTREQKNVTDSINFKDSIDKKKIAINKKTDSTTLKIDSLLQSTKDSLLGKILTQVDNANNGKPTKTIEIGRLLENLKFNLKFPNINLDTAIRSSFDKELNFATDTFFDSINKQLSVNLFGSAEVYKILNQTFKDLKSKVDTASYQAKKRVDSIYDDLLKNSDTLRRKLYLTQDSLLNYTQPKIISPQPFQVFNTDLTHISYTIKKGTTENAKKETREIVLKNKGGFKIDFSTGFVGTGLLDDNYKVVSDSANATTAKLINETKGNFSIGFGLLAHAYCRTGERINFALSAGLMINSSNQNVNYTTGVSIPLGLEERFIFNAGIIYGKVKRLAAGYSEGSNTQNRLLLTTNNGNVATIEKWDNSWYIGLSFNIGSISASKKYAFNL